METDAPFNQVSTILEKWEECFADAIDWRRMINVVNKMCEHEGCHKRPSLNYPGVRPAIRCGEHKLPGMTNSFRKLDTNILSGELKEKAEELKKRPKKEAI